MKNDMIKWRVYPTDTERLDYVNSQYEKALAVLKSIESRFNPYELFATSIANTGLQNFRERMEVFSKEKYPLCAYFNGCPCFADVCKITEDKLLENKYFRATYEEAKNLDNKLLLLICNDVQGSNPLRSFVGREVLQGVPLPPNFTEKDYSEVCKYIAVKLKEAYAKITEVVFKIPSMCVPLDDMLSNPKFTGEIRLEQGVRCMSIDFMHDGELRHLDSEKQICIDGRRSILRPTLLEVLNYIISNNIVRVASILPMDAHFYMTKSWEEASELSLQQNFSCSILTQKLADGTEDYLLVHPDAPRTALKQIQTLLRGIGAGSAVLNFERVNPSK